MSEKTESMQNLNVRRMLKRLAKKRGTIPMESRYTATLFKHLAQKKGKKEVGND